MDGLTPTFRIVTLLIGCRYCIKRNVPFFFDIIIHWFEYGALDGSRIPMLTFSLSSSISFKIWALGTVIGLMPYSTCGIVKITIGSTIVGSTHPILSGANANSFPWLLSITQNLFSSTGSRKPPPPILSLHSARQWTGVLCHEGLVCLGLSRPLSSFRSTILYLVFMLVVQSALAAHSNSKDS